MRVGDPPITFVYHLGVHCTDEDLLLRSLIWNGAALIERKVAIPRPRTYRARLGELAARYRGDPVSDAEQQELLDHVLQGHGAERVIFSHDNFLCMPTKVFDQGQLYQKARYRSTWLRYVFPENPCEFFLAVRNPATFIPAAMENANIPEYDRFMNGADPRQLSWASLIASLRENNPGCPITVWCNEDTPLIWPEILREITASGPEQPIVGQFELLRMIMKKEGLERMEAYLNEKPPQTEEQHRRVISAFLDKFGIDEEIVEEIDLPGWTPQMVDEISQRYEDDVAQIGRMPGVTLLTT